MFSGLWKLFPLSKFFPHHTDKISSADLQDFLNFPSQPKFPQSEGHLPPSGACTLYATLNTTATEDREEPVVEEENEGQRKITEFLLVENDDDEDDNSLSTQELIIDARARKANRNMGKLKCDVCEFETWSETLLTRHVEKSHQQENIYQCEQCEFRFGNNNELNVHISDIHSETGPSVNHDDIVQGEPDPVQVRDRKSCEECGFRTTSDDVLTKHVNINHKNRNKPTTNKSG